MGMGGKGGSSPAGDTTTTINNPTSDAQRPFLQHGWDSAQNLYDNNKLNYYPGQTLADFNPWVGGGLTDMIRAGQGMGQFGQEGADFLQQMGTGGFGVQNSPAYGALQNLISGHGTTGLDQLSKTASGDYLNSNPYVDKMYGSASDAVTRAYQTATAPQTDSAMEAGGRYGGGALANARSQNEQDLGKTLGNLSSNIYGQNYANERGLQVGAANQLGQLGKAGAGLMQEGYQTGNQQQMGALGMVPGMENMRLQGANAELQGGQGFTAMDQAKIGDQMARYYGEQQAPWQQLAQYMNLIGQPTMGSSKTTQPYFQNQLANLLGTGVGGLGLYNGLNTAMGGGGLGSLFGGGAAAGGDFGGGGAAMGVADQLGGAGAGGKGGKGAADAMALV